MNQIDRITPQSSGPIKQQIVSNPFPAEQRNMSHNVKSDDLATTNEGGAQPATNSLSTPLSAHDADLIEKEWVSSAEKLIESYGADPYTLQQRQSAMSRDYLKKRFNLDVGQS